MLARLLHHTRMLIRAFRGQIGGRAVPGLPTSIFAIALGSRTIRVGDSAVLTPNSSEAMFLLSEIFLSETYRTEIENPSPRILDCGANCGVTTAYFKILYPLSSIVCFEPNPTSFELLQNNVLNNRWANVELVQAACGSENGSITFHQDNSNSLISSTFAERSNGNAFEVKTVRLSDWIGSGVDLLKLDIEGAEHAVLHELADSGSLTKIKRMAIEYHHRMESPKCHLASFLKLLEDHNFTYAILAGEAPNMRYGNAFQDIMIYAYQIG